MIVTIAVACISAHSENFNPELLFIGTVWIDLAILKVIESVL